RDQRHLPPFPTTLFRSWYARLDEAEDRQWFDLEMGIEVEGQRISLLPILLQAIRTRPWLLSGEAQDSEDDVLFGLLPSGQRVALDRKSTRLNSSHVKIS